MTRPSWDFEYRPIATGPAPAKSEEDFVVATWSETRPEDLARTLGTLRIRAEVETLLVRPPLFWYRVHVEPAQTVERLRDALGAAGENVRYVTSALRPSTVLGPRPNYDEAAAAVPRAWQVRQERHHRDERSRGHWFLGETGVDVERAVCGSGAGTRLGVIDDEARDADLVDLDAEVLVGVPAPSRSAVHGSAMVAWAVGSRGRTADGIPPYRGVAPDASPRLYCIPRPGHELTGLPLAIVRAVDDGADVVVCATYVEGTTSPLLDDALDFATRLGRGGKGTAVVIPTGREISSPHGSVHASLSLGFAEPASDSRVLCVAPSGRDGGWFLWTDKRGKRKPFANRGPSARLSAPGDDVTYPFAGDGRLGHTESSGASAFAAGLALLTLGKNPELTVHELYAVLARTARACVGGGEGAPLADPADVLPSGRDPDGHDARCGYGRGSALRACLSVTDPVLAALCSMGEEDAATRFASLRSRSGPVRSAYSEELGRWAARVVLADGAGAHAVKALLRHLRLLSERGDRRPSHTAGAAARALALIVERLSEHTISSPLKEQLDSLRLRARAATESMEASKTLETALYEAATQMWAQYPPVQRCATPFDDRSVGEARH